MYETFPLRVRLSTADQPSGSGSSFEGSEDDRAPRAPLVVEPSSNPPSDDESAHTVRPVSPADGAPTVIGGSLRRLSPGS